MSLSLSTRYYTAYVTALILYKRPDIAACSFNGIDFEVQRAAIILVGINPYMLNSFVRKNLFFCGFRRVFSKSFFYFDFTEYQQNKLLQIISGQIWTW